MLTLEGAQTLGAEAIVEKLAVRRAVLKLSCSRKFKTSSRQWPYKAHHAPRSPRALVPWIQFMDPAVPESPTPGHEDGRTALRSSLA